MALQRKLFLISVWYFKPSGKFYTEAEIEMECAVTGNDHCYMPSVVEKLKNLGGENLPGLSCLRWNGPVLVNCEAGFPVLLPNGLGDDGS